MTNPLFKLLGGKSMNILPPPLNNISNFIEKFNQFRSTFNGNPQQEIQRRLNAGEISQEQINQIMPLAKQIQQMLSR